MDLPSANVTKTGRNTDADPFEFVLSDESVDRMGDIIRADGWSLSDFKRNPIALFGHDHTKIVGVWKDVRVVGKRLLGRLKLASPGTSELVDTTRQLIEQNILRAVSVGFQPIEATPRKDGGWEYTKSALHEVSLVSVPANANALQIMKGLSQETIDILTAKAGTADDASLGRATFETKTPNLDAARQRAAKLGIR